MKTIGNLFLLTAALAPTFAAAATIPDPVSDPAFRTGVSASEVREFASGFTFYDPAGRAEGANDPSNGVGAADGVTVSLGDLTSDELDAGQSPGQIILEFSRPVFNGPGADLAVFENAFDFGFFSRPEVVFGELAFVEVSTNGADFARFPSISLNILPDDTIDQPNELVADTGFGFNLSFAGVNSEFISNLAGVHSNGFGADSGTPFDLEDLVGDDLVIDGVVDLNSIRFVRIVDIPGTGDIVDSLGNPIFDASLTTGTGGFDLDAVGALNVVPEPSALVLAVLGGCVATRGRRR